MAQARIGNVTPYVDDGYHELSSPVVYRFGRRALIVISGEEKLVADPETGAVRPYEGGRTVKRPKPVVSFNGLCLLESPGFADIITFDFRSFHRVWRAGKVGIYEERIDIAKTVKEIAGYADDLEHGDSFDWSRGHMELGRNGIVLAAPFLHLGLRHESRDVRRSAGLAVTWLLEHRAHCCFRASALGALNGVVNDLRAAAVEESDPEVKAVFDKAIETADSEYDVFPDFDFPHFRY